MTPLVYNWTAWGVIAVDKRYGEDEWLLMEE